VPFPPPRTALAKWQAASTARMGTPETWSWVSEGKQPLNSYSKAIQAWLCVCRGSRTSQQGFGRGRTRVLRTLLVLNVMSITNFRAKECPGGAMGDFSAALVSELTTNRDPVLHHCSCSVSDEAVECCKQIHCALS